MSESYVPCPVIFVFKIKSLSLGKGSGLPRLIVLLFRWKQEFCLVAYQVYQAHVTGLNITYPPLVLQGSRWLTATMHYICLPLDFYSFSVIKQMFDFKGGGIFWQQSCVIRKILLGLITYFKKEKFSLLKGQILYFSCILIYQCLFIALFI